jgi:hypothetical protein
MKSLIKLISYSIWEGISTAFKFSIITYIVLAAIYAWDWFVFLIIRLVVVIFLTIPSLFIIPFKEDIEIISIIKIPALIGLFLGALYGISQYNKEET